MEPAQDKVIEIGVSAFSISDPQQKTSPSLETKSKNMGFLAEYYKMKNACGAQAGITPRVQDYEGAESVFLTRSTRHSLAGEAGF